MENQFDLIVIGTGSGGSVAANKCKSAGWNVAIIDSSPFGGTCALRGCDPKKVLVGATELVDWSHRMEGKGVASDAVINWQELMSFKKTFTESVPENIEESLEHSGIKTYHGRARFIDKQTLQVGEDVLYGKHILIANGAKPVSLGITGEEYLTYSDEFLELESLPNRIVFVGGGYISFEFAHIAARAGAEVHIIQRGERPLKGFDQDLVELLVGKTKEIGIKLHLDTNVTEIKETKDQFIVYGNKDGKTIPIDADLVVHGAGRVPDIEDMDLDNGDVEKEKQGVRVNEFLQSVSNPHVYSAGDAASTDGLPLTPVASMESHIVAANLLKGNKRTTDYTAMPTAVFTIPSMASVGLSEHEAKEKSYNFHTKYSETSDWYSTRRVNEKPTAYKILVEKDTDRILGAHLLGGKAPEVINLFVMAIKSGMTAKDIKTTLFAYPTNGLDITYML